MNFLLQLTGNGGGGHGGGGHGSAASKSATSHKSHRSARESTGRRVHVEATSLHRHGTTTIDVGTTVVIQRETPEHDHGGGSYRVASQGRRKSTTSRDKLCFLAIVAPTTETAMAYLATQPPGTFVLVVEDDDLVVFVKFREAVRSHLVLRNRDIKRPSDHIVDWGRPYRSHHLPEKHADALLDQPTLMTPVHCMYLPTEAYLHLEHVWKRFLPLVQAIAFELCVQPFYTNEETAEEDWGACVLSARVPCVAFLASETCGFYLFNAASANGTTLSSPSLLGSTASHNNHLTTGAYSSTIPVRYVEFDVARCLVVISDGTFRPSAFGTATHLGTKRLYDGELSFQAVRDNFFHPDQVALKEANTHSAESGLSMPGAPPPSSLCEDLTEEAHAHADTELELLRAVQVACATVIPHEPIPEALLSSIHALHAHWTRPGPHRDVRWSTTKNHLAGFIMAYYVELHLAMGSTGAYVQDHLRAHGRRNLLPAFTLLLRTDLLFMARRVGDLEVSRLSHHVLQTLGMRSSFPVDGIRLIRELFAALPAFRMHFIRNEGHVILWKSAQVLHTMGVSTTTTSRLLAQAPTSTGPMSNRPPLSEISKRRSSLFGMRRKSNLRTRASISFSSSLILSSTHENEAQVFFRLNPLMAQLQVADMLREGDLSLELTALGRGSVRPSSVVSESIALVTEIATRLLRETASPTWESDVTTVLRLNALYENLHHELVAVVGDMGTAATSRRFEAILQAITVLFELETKRRRHATTTVGDKKFWFLFHLLRAPVRDFHESLRGRLGASADINGSDGSDVGLGEDLGPATRAFRVLTRVLPVLPRQLLTEFVLVALDDLLQTAAVVREAMAAASHPMYVRCVRYILEVYTVTLRRTRDLDLQMLLLRVVASRGSSIPALVQLLVDEAAAETSTNAHNDGDEGEEGDTMGDGIGAIAAAATTSTTPRLPSNIQLELLAFMDAFVALAGELPRLDHWVRLHPSPPALADENAEDLDTNEQRKTMLMASVLSPENGIAESDEILWDTIQELLLLPPGGASPSRQQQSALRVVRCYNHEKLSLWGTSAEEATVLIEYLLVRQRLYGSILMDSPVVAKLVPSFVRQHWTQLEQLGAAYGDPMLGPTERGECRRLVELHLQCLMSLAARTRTPELNEVIVGLGLASRLLQSLKLAQHTPQAAPHNDRDGREMVDNTDGRAGASDDSSSENETRPAALPSLNLSHISSTRSDVLDPGHGSSKALSEILVGHPEVHAAAVLVIISCLLEAPNRLDPRLAPRYFLPPVGTADKADGETPQPVNIDLLLGLQRHLGHCPENVVWSITEALRGAEIHGVLGSPARVASAHTLVRLLLPDSYHHELFATIPTATAVADANDQNENNAGDDNPAVQRRYVAKGAFATVYEATPVLGGAARVAIKTLAHQRHEGELAVVGEAFNEVSVLLRLRGNRAATQLLDYGSSATSGSIELVLEHCAAMLSTWRRGLAVADLPPFKTFAMMLLSILTETTRCLAQVHADGVCHFDIKGENVLVRVEPEALTADLLRHIHLQHQDTQSPPQQLDGGERPSLATIVDGKLCLGDFGESVLVPNGLRDDSVIALDRTRGTEAIKSPEMLRVRGGDNNPMGTVDPGSPSVGPASDVWSIGCLMYELITDELLFAQDDWAGLFAHLVASDTPVLRPAQYERALAALRPATGAERGLADVILQLLSRILTRESKHRPTIPILHAELTAHLRMIEALPSTAEDESYVLTRLGQLPSRKSPAVPVVANSTSSSADLLRPPTPTSEAAATTTTTTTPTLPASSASRRRHHKTGRILWNLHVATGLRELLDGSQAFTKADAGVRRGSHVVPMRSSREDDDDDTALRRLELEFEGAFGHFVYVRFDPDPVEERVARSDQQPGAPTGAGDDQGQDPPQRPPGDDGPFLEAIEQLGRTTLVVHRRRLLGAVAAAVSARPQAMSSCLVTLLLQYSRGLLPVLQRRLQHEPQRVLIVPVIGSSPCASSSSCSARPPGDPATPDAEPLRLATALTILYFLVGSCGLSPIEALGAFAREGAGVLGVPLPVLLAQLGEHHTQLLGVRGGMARIERTQHARRVVHCRCGDKVFGLPVAAAATTTLWPAGADDLRSGVDADDGDGDDCRGLEAEVVHDYGDARVAHPELYLPRTPSGAAPVAPTLRTASWTTAGTAIATPASTRSTWVVVATPEVERLESQLRAVLVTYVGAGPTSPHDRMRRKSLNLLHHRGHSAHHLTTHPHHSQQPPSHPTATVATAVDTAATWRQRVSQLLFGLIEVPISASTEGGRRNEDDGPWTRRFVCRMCGTTMCVVSDDSQRLALPLDYGA